MQAHPARDKSLGLVLGRAALDPDRGPAADVVEEIVAVLDLRHAQKRQEFGIEAARLSH